MAEWSNATDLRSVLFGGAGSNPAGATLKAKYSKNNSFSDFQSERVGSIPTLETTSVKVAVIKTFA